MVGPEIVGAPSWLDRFATLGKSALLIELQDRNAVLDSLGSCKFAACALSDDYLAALLSALWDETVDPLEMSRAGSRIWHLEKLFNLAAGFTRADDTLPRRLLRSRCARVPRPVTSWTWSRCSTSITVAATGTPGAIRTGRPSIGWD